MSIAEFESYDDIEERLREAVAEPGPCAWSRENGVHRNHVCEVLRGTRKPSASIARALGFRMRVVFERIGE